MPDESEHQLHLPFISKAQPPQEGDPSLVFLPFISKAEPPQPDDPFHVFLPAVMRSSDSYRIEDVRLWSAEENGARPGIPCGDRNCIQVHVFDTAGDVGDSARMNDVMVAVTHTIGNGQQTEALKTGANGMPRGVAAFRLHDFARIQLVAGKDGQPVISPVIELTSLPARIAPQELIRAGFCRDEGEAQRFAAEGRCRGSFSWNVVFIRNSA